jgi:hypothetical protein
MAKASRQPGKISKTKKRYANIKLEELLKEGWVKTDDPVAPFKKALANRNPLNSSEDSQLHLVIHHYFNTAAFAVLLPDGGLLNFVANSMKELHEFENKIQFYDPPF